MIRLKKVTFKKELNSSLLVKVDIIVTNKNNPIIPTTISSNPLLSAIFMFTKQVTHYKSGNGC